LFCVERKRDSRLLREHRHQRDVAELHVDAVPAARLADREQPRNVRRQLVKRACRLAMSRCMSCRYRSFDIAHFDLRIDAARRRRRSGRRSGGCSGVGGGSGGALGLRPLANALNGARTPPARPACTACSTRASCRRSARAPPQCAFYIFHNTKKKKKKKIKKKTDC
jgi:hypothetical protein